jgi:hypothetical protein
MGWRATIRDALLVVAIKVKVPGVADEARLAVRISCAATKVLASAMSADRVGLNAVLIRCAAWVVKGFEGNVIVMHFLTWLAVPGLAAITIEAVVMFRDAA